MPDIEPLEEGEEIGEDWIAAMVAAVNAAKIAQGQGGDIIPIESEGGTVLRLSNLARYQVRPAIVVVQAPAATIVAGDRECGLGTVRIMRVTAIGGGTTPPTLTLGVNEASDEPVPFYNPYASGPSATAGKLILVFPTPWGWMLSTTECS